MSDIGYLKLFRQIQNNYLWDDKPFAKGQAWIDLLILTNFKDGKMLLGNELRTIGRGSFHTSLPKLADRWGWNKKTVSRFLDLLESDGMLSQKRDTKGITLTIVKYEDFQKEGSADGTAVRTADGMSSGTHCGTQSNRTVDTIEERKNIKESKEGKERKNNYGTFDNVQLTDAEYEKLQEIFPNDYEEKINTLSEYMKSKGKTYKSHYATILNWNRLDQKRQQEQDKPKTSAYMDAIKNRISIVDSWVQGGNE